MNVRFAIATHVPNENKDLSHREISEWILCRLDIDRGSGHIVRITGKGIPGSLRKVKFPGCAKKPATCNQALPLPGDTSLCRLLQLVC